MDERQKEWLRSNFKWLENSQLNREPTAVPDGIFAVVGHPVHRVFWEYPESESSDRLTRQRSGMVENIIGDEFAVGEWEQFTDRSGRHWQAWTFVQVPPASRWQHFFWKLLLPGGILLSAWYLLYHLFTYASSHGDKNLSLWAVMLMFVAFVTVLYTWQSKELHKPDLSAHPNRRRRRNNARRAACGHGRMGLVMLESLSKRAGSRTALIGEWQQHRHPMTRTQTSSTKKNLMEEPFSEEEQKLAQLLGVIEAGLRSRPNPSFSMVSLRLETTPSGRKIVWCYRTRYDEPCAMDEEAATNFLNEELSGLGVVVSNAGYLGKWGEGNELFDYKFRDL